MERGEREGDGRLDAHPLVREYFGVQLRREQAEAWREGNRRLYEYLQGKAKELPETVGEMAPLVCGGGPRVSGGEEAGGIPGGLVGAHPARAGGLQEQPSSEPSAARSPSSRPSSIPPGSSSRRGSTRRTGLLS